MAREPLIDAKELSGPIGARCRIIDLRPREEFAAGRIPGGVSSPYKEGWRVRAGAAPGLLPTPEDLARLIGATGLRPDERAVLVSGATASEIAGAARAYWTLRTAGHGDASVLDGGFPAWLAAGLPVDTGPAAEPPHSVYPVKLDIALRSDLAETERALAAGSAMFVDARQPAQFTGAAQSGDVAAPGHMPGAFSLPYETLLEPGSGKLLPRQVLAGMAPAEDGRPAIAYCNTGHTAALGWFVLSELLGREARLFDGSMAEWTADPVRPVVRTA